MALQASRQGLQQFQDERFGMFIHWGLYSLIGHGEWVMHHEKIAVQEYEKLAPQFNPVKFNAEEWVSVAADAGQRYIVITSRHHDGFSMYDTQLSDYKITNTPFRRDPLAELANACARRSDIRLGFYNSLLDWHHPAYRFRKQSGLAWSDYIEFLHGQVRELCTNFGEIACMWFDGDWPRQLLDKSNAYFEAGGSFEYERLYDMIHILQPGAVVHNNRHARPLPGEDVQGFEQDLPGENTVGFNTTEIFAMPVEVCMTINDNWGIHFADDNHKSTGRLIHSLVKSAAFGGNYLLNVGPTAEGEILPVHVQRLREMGAWLQLYGESIYATRAGSVTGVNIASTCRADTTYVHLLDYTSDRVALHNVPQAVSKAELLRDGSPLKMIRQGDEVFVTVPAEQRDVMDTVICLRE